MTVQEHMELHQYYAAREVEHRKAGKQREMYAAQALKEYHAKRCGLPRPGPTGPKIRLRK